MPRQEQILSVFVASPSDVGNEREKLEEVIRELNNTWSRELGIRLELVRWETHAYPGMGTDAQDVINQQIPDDYDLFVGIMWCRYGTQTNRSGSGTVEEFERAKARYNSHPNSVKLMMYFKDEAVPPSQLDTDQLAAVHKFRKSLGEVGSLYWEFNSLEQFEKLIRLHLTRQVQSWGIQLGRQTQVAQTVDEEVIDKEPADELGLLDYAEILEEQFSGLKDTAERLTSSIDELSARMRERTVEMDALPRDSQGNANRKDVRRLISRAATDMEQFASRTDVEIPLFSTALNSGMTALTRFILLSVDLNRDNDMTKRTHENLETIVSLKESLSNSEKSTRNFQETIATLPRMTSDLNQAKRKAVSALDKLLNEFSNGLTLLSEAEVATRAILEAE